MASNRKIEALRALAERPGTEAEGRVAREMLRKIEARDPVEASLGKFRTFLRTGAMDDLEQALGPCYCECGSRRSRFGRCANLYGHDRLREEIRHRFPRGARVYYNYWAYEPDCPATVVGYPTKPDGWAWVRLKFDHLKNVRAVPILWKGTWMLSTEPQGRSREEVWREFTEWTDG